MPRNIEFVTKLDIRDAEKALDALNRKAEETSKSIQRLSEKQTTHAANSVDAKKQAEDLRRQAQAVKNYIDQNKGDKTKATDIKEKQEDYKRLIQDAKQLEATAKAEEKQALSTGADIDKKIQQYQQLQTAIQGTKDQIAQLYQQMAQQRMERISAPLNAWADSLNDKLTNAFQSAGNAAKSLATKLGGTLLSGIKSVGTAAFNAAKGGLQALWNGVRKIASGAVNGAINGIKMLGKALGSLASKAGGAVKGLLGLNKSHRSLGDGMKHGFMTFVKYAFGVRSLYFLFRKLRSAVTEAVKSFAEQDATTKATIDSLSASLNTMKASWGAAFAPILNMVAPMLQTLISWCTSAANAVAALFAALSGAKTFKTAAAGANQLGKATGGAAKEAKEAKKQLAGFDDLEILKSDNDTSGAGGGGGAAGATYTDNEIPDWAKKIKEMIENGQWHELANMIVDKMNEITETVRQHIAEWGYKIGYWVNGAFTVLADIIKKYDWRQIGELLALGLNALISSINWRNLGVILMARAWILLNMLAGFLKNFDWAAAVKAAFDVLLGAVLDLDWVQLEADLVDGFATALNGIASGISELPLTELTEGINQMLRDKLTKVRWGELGRSISNFLHITITSATAILRGLDMTLVAANIQAFISGTIGEIDIGQLTTDVLGFFSSLFQDATTALVSTNWAEAAQHLSDSISSMFTAVGWSELSTSLSNFLHGIIRSASLFVRNLDTETIARNFGTFIETTFTNLDIIGIANDLATYIIDVFTKASQFGDGTDFSAIGANLSSFISDALTNIKWGELVYKAMELIKKMVKDATALIQGINVPEILEALKTFFSNVFSNIDIAGLANDVFAFIEELLNKGVELLQGGGNYYALGGQIWMYFKQMIDGIHWDSLATAIFRALGAALGTAVAAIWGFIKSAITSIFDYFRDGFVEDENGDGIKAGKEIINGILKGVTEGLKTIYSWIKENVWTPFINAVKNAFGIHSPASTMIFYGWAIAKGILKGILSVFEGIYEWLKTNIFDPFIKGVKGLFGIEGGNSSELLNIGKNIINGLKDGISAGIDAVVEVIGNLKNSIIEKFNGIKETVKGIWSSIFGGEDDSNIPQTAEYLAAKAQYEAAAAAYKTYVDENSGYATDDAGLYYYNEGLKTYTENLEKATAALATAKQAALETAEATGEYSTVLAEEGTILDENGQVVQKTADSVTTMATAAEQAATSQQQAAQATADANNTLSNTHDNTAEAATGYTDLENASSEATAALKSDAQIIVVDGKELASGIKESTDQAAADFETMHTSISETLDSMEVKFTTWGSSVTGIFDGVLEKLREISGNITTTISEMSNTWKSDWGRPVIHYPVFSLSGILDFRTGQIPQIMISDWLYAAKGGIISSATPLIAGEAGKEAIVPLERNTEWIDLVANGLMERLEANSFLNRLSEAFATVPMPAVANGAVVPPKAFTESFGGEWGNSLMSELQALRSEIAALASQPVQVNSKIYMDRREVGKGVTEFQRQQSRSGGF